MPRKPTDQVIEHRITLGDYERSELESILNIRKTNDIINASVNGGKAVLYAGMAGVIGYVAYLAAVQIYDLVDEVTEPVKNAIYGKPTYPTTNPPPPNKDDWVNRDPETGERINPMHPVPIAGGLTGLGIQLGEAVPVGSWLRSGFESLASITSPDFVPN